jgi:hypothetical protein
MSRDLRKLAEENKSSINNSNTCTGYLELNKSSYSHAATGTGGYDKKEKRPSADKTAIQSHEQTSAENNAMSSSFKPNASNKVISKQGLGSYNIQERPASRMEIKSLEGLTIYFLHYKFQIFYENVSNSRARRACPPRFGQ